MKNQNDMAALATNPQKQQIHRLKRRYGWDEDTYRMIVREFSNGRTDTSSELTKYEASVFIRAFTDPSEDRRESERKKSLQVVRAIYAVSLEISFLNKDNRSNEPDEVEMNKAKINRFVTTHGAVKKPVSKQNYEELNITLKLLKKIAEREKSITP